MTRKEAIETLRANYPDACFEQLREAVDKAIEALEADAQSVQRWIPCSERLPEEGVDVLLCIKDWKSQKTKMVVSLRRDYNYWDGLGREIRGDMAWMPLPKPWRDGEQNG